MRHDTFSESDSPSRAGKSAFSAKESPSAAQGLGSDGPRPAPIEVPRVLGRVGTPGRGPTLVCVGGIHGNEPSGVLALQQIFARLAEDERGLQGCLIGLSGNRAALARAQRFIDTDLNRAWTDERVTRLRAGQMGSDSEDVEQRELDEQLRAVFDEAGGSLAVLDLHSTSGGGPAFTTLDDTLSNRELAVEIPSPQVLGLEEEISGTLIGRLVERGATAIGFEAGQHANPESVNRAQAAIWIAMESAGVLEREVRPEVAEGRALLILNRGSLPPVVEVRHREHVVSGDGFAMEPGFNNFQAVREGEALASRNGDVIAANLGGLILMPLYQDQGEDGFFLIQPVRPMWLRISAALRRWHLERIVHWFPGVRRNVEMPGSFIVNRKRARWFSREIFHLLGFRRHSVEEDRLVMSPRDIHH